MEEWLQTEWPDLRVRLTSVSDHFATIAVVGPHAREVVRALTPDIDVERSAFPFMTLRGFVAWWIWGIAHIYFLVGVPSPVLVSLRWLWEYVTYGRGARLITGQEDAD